MKAYRKWTVGEPRTTISNKPLKGLNKSTFCVFHLMPFEKEIGLENFLEESLANLAAHTKYLATLHATGGRLELYLSCFCNENIGMAFDWKVLSKFANQKIDLQFEFFPKPHDFTLKQLPEWYFKCV
jgi:hypothetical protein